MVTASCERCGAQFQAYQSALEAGRRFCSRPCFYAGWGDNYQDRFWATVDKDGPVPAHQPELGPCWIWLGPRQIDKRRRLAYGHFTLRRRHYLAHRMAYTLTNGEIPEGLQVCHACDNPPCVNPAHLWLGTNADNTRDSVAKGRHWQGFHLPANRGERNPSAKLTAAQVAEIRRRGAVERSALLAVEFGVSHHHINDIKRGVAWAT